MHRETVDAFIHLRLRLAELEEEYEEIAAEVQHLQTAIEMAHKAGEDIKDLFRIQIQKVKRARDLLNEFCSLVRNSY
jgi:hypothetical protein